MKLCYSSVFLSFVNTELNTRELNEALILPYPKVNCNDYIKARERIGRKIASRNSIYGRGQYAQFQVLGHTDITRFG